MAACLYGTTAPLLQTVRDLYSGGQLPAQANNEPSEPGRAVWLQVTVVLTVIIVALAIGTFFQNTPSESLQLERHRVLSYEKNPTVHDNDRNELYRNTLANTTAELKDADTPSEKATVLLQQALAYHRLNDNDHALADLGTIIANPKSGAESISEAHMTRGAIEALRGDYQAAISDYTAVPYSWENQSTVQIDKGMVYLRWGKPDKALPIFDALIAAFPATCARFRSMLGNNSFPDRVFITKEVASLCGQLATYEYAGRATSRRELGNYQGALADYKIAISHDPYSAELVGREAQTYLEMGNFSDALSGYWHRMVLAYGPRPRQRWR